MTERLRGRRAVIQRRRRLARSNGLCEACMAATPPRIVIATVVDHIIPLAHGGTDDDANTRNSCSECDRQLTAKQFGNRYRPKIGPDGWPES